MFFADLPNELVIEIINKLEYFDILNLFRTCKRFRYIINNNTVSIFHKLNFKKMSNLNFEEYSKLYLENAMEKKKALILIKYIYKWLTSELFDSIMERSIIHRSMTEATIKYSKLLCETKEEDINSRSMIKNENKEKKIKPMYYVSHRHLKSIIEEFINEDLLNSININRIIVDDFTCYEKFNSENPNIYIFNKDFITKNKYKIKIDKYDLRLFSNNF